MTLVSLKPDVHGRLVIYKAKSGAKTLSKTIEQLLPKDSEANDSAAVQ